jgi:hypothetical protein
MMLGQANSNKQEINVVVQLKYSILVETDNGKFEISDRLIFKDIEGYWRDDELLKITSKTGKKWLFPYHNIKSIEYTENDKQRSKY